jgi:DNA repair exonuclease SbcCD nuclease subunit
VNILFIGDPHLRINTFEQSVKFLRWVEDVAQEHKPDVVCNLGDTFHNHAVLRSELLKEFKDHVENITNIPDTEYWYVLGNHDQWKPKDSKYHALQALDNISNFTVFDKVTELNEHNITVVPYVQKYEDFPLKTNDICITHNTFIGADYGFKREDCGIDSGKVSADIIISGHIHKRQSFGTVVYPGTPYAHSANDVDQTKGLLLFDSKTYKQEFIESPFPKWRSLEFSVSKTTHIVHLHTMLSKELDSENKWILKLGGPKAEILGYLKSKEYLDLIKGKNIIVKTDMTDSQKNNRVKIKASSPSEIVEEYINKVYNGGLDKSLIIHKAQEIIKHT